jgi:hypothetical protein
VAFILGANRRDEDPVEAFSRYTDYLRAKSDIFPHSAFALATANWYFDPRDHRCPHDAWLESTNLHELSSGERDATRYLSLTVRLLGPYHDGLIEFHYPRVFSYALNAHDSEGGQRDWRYDEFRVSAAGKLIHEIEWSGAQDTGRWLIEASDVTFRWIPK